ncbi:hypothetical protein [Fundidesulfovibrio putealis]|nr:hypothetical protein [Fundidesulfovibrio putealis]
MKIMKARFADAASARFLLAASGLSRLTAPGIPGCFGKAIQPVNRFLP